MRAAIAALAALALLAGCSSDSGQMDGPCVHQYLGPVLVLTEATVDGQQIDQIDLRAMRLDGGPVELTDTSGLQIGPVGQVLCTLPCAFGEQPGHWQVAVHGPDGSRGRVDVQAEYSDGEGDCPSYSFDGSDVAVTLTQADEAS